MEDLDFQFHRMKMIGRRQNFHYFWLALILIINISLAAFIFLSSQWLKAEFYKNPMFDNEARFTELSQKSLSLFKEFQTKRTAFNSQTSIEAFVVQEDPQQVLLRYLIDSERDAQNYMLYTLAAVSDLSRHVGGIEEWYLYEEAKIKNLISSSRNRQKSLRGMLKNSESQSKR